MTAKLRHIAMNVPDVQKAAAFYENALGMTRVGENDHAGATAVYLTDGTVNLALLHYKTEEAAGGDPKDYGVHHFGFVVDDPAAAQAEIEAAGGNWLMGEAKDSGVFYEIKFRDPDGQIFDINESGWKTAED
jgi:catechol 2,3-dioxygenase-like lactoylglutathione lyase family enzyme